MIEQVLSGARRWHVEQGEALAVLQSLPDACVDMFATDSPYSSGGQFRGDRIAGTTSKYVASNQRLQREDFAGDNRDQRAFGYWCALWLSQALRVSKPGGVCCLFTDWRQLPTTTDALQAGGWVWRGIVPWNKTEAARPQKGRFRAQCEYVVWGSNGPMSDDGPVLPGFFEKYLTPADRHHIAGKPVDVMQEIVRICPPDGVVLDVFGGSMSTIVAALIEGRRGIGIDLLPGNVDIGRERLTNLDAGHAPRPGKVTQLSMVMP